MEQHEIDRFGRMIAESARSMTPVQVREAAAKIAETFPDLDFGNWKGRPPKEDIAASIRALPLPPDPRDEQLRVAVEAATTALKFMAEQADEIDRFCADNQEDETLRDPENWVSGYGYKEACAAREALAKLRSAT